MNTVARTLAAGIATLERSSDSPRTDVLLLMERVFARRREWIVSHGEASISAADVERFAQLCLTRSVGTPLAYILGSVGFSGREFLVNESTLIPRPQTEHLLEEAIDFIRAAAAGRIGGVVSVLDVGTGCGAIACTVAADTGAWADGTDTSSAALEIATRNARRLGVLERCRFHLGDLADPVKGRRFTVVIANLPYIPSADLPERPNPVAFEPRQALDGGRDGLALYRRLVVNLPELLEPNGMVLLEAAPPTIAQLHALTAAALPNCAVCVGYDYTGLARYIKAGPKVDGLPV